MDNLIIPPALFKNLSAADELLKILGNHSAVQINGTEAKENVKDTEPEPEEPVDTTPAGMRCDTKNLYQKPDSRGRDEWVEEYPDNIHNPVENEKTAKFALLIRNRKSYDSRKKF